MNAQTERPTRAITTVLIGGFILVGVAGAIVAGQTRTVWDGIYTDAQADRGEPLYKETCASCHSEDLSGGQMVPGLVGGDFTWNWSGLTVGQLFERLRISMPQEDPASVSRQEKADILAYILRVNEFPSGDTELASRTEILEQVMFEAVQP
jgi:S-disulfanyl-L-cysteine oxidoreductase SoxD